MAARDPPALSYSAVNSGGSRSAWSCPATRFSRFTAACTSAGEEPVRRAISGRGPQRDERADPSPPVRPQRGRPSDQGDLEPTSYRCSVKQG
jgi:hypothetical protein